jgi:hypothetical protein
MNSVFKNSQVAQRETYHVGDFQYRLVAVQNLLKKQGIDALLIINGADGLSNVENKKFTNFLWKGFSGREFVSGRS